MISKTVIVIGLSVRVTLWIWLPKSGALISYLYAEIDSINPIAGLLFKKGVQVALEEDSVVWQYDKNYRANPESQVITMIKPRHDDG